MKTKAKAVLVRRGLRDFKAAARHLLALYDNNNQLLKILCGEGQCLIPKWADQEVGGALVKREQIQKAMDDLAEEAHFRIDNTAFDSYFAVDLEMFRNWAGE